MVQEEKMVAMCFFCGKGGGMANHSVITLEAWEEARRAAEAGLSLREVAEDYGVDYETVKKRAQREEWLTVAKLESLLAERKADKLEVSENSEKSRNVPLAAESIAKRLEALHTANKLGLARAAGKGIETALDKMESGEIEVSSIQDLQTLANIAKIAWGGDSNGGNAVQVNVLSSGGYEFSPASAESMCI